MGAADLVVSDNRIDYRRGPLSEWYVNDEAGLEQGFTLDAPRHPRSSSGVRLELALTGDLRPELTPDGTAIDFTTSSGEAILRYGDLQATDATGKKPPIRLELTQSRSTQYAIRVSVDDADAAYPITVSFTTTSLAASADGLSTTPDWTAEGDQAIARFGFSVGTAGDVNGDGYDDVIVGAPYYNDDQTDEGRAFVYHGSDTGLSTTPDWTAEGNQTSTDQWDEPPSFGWSVGTAGDVNGDGYDDVIIGAPGYDNDLEDEGSVFVYLGSAAGLGTTADWTAESDQMEAWFGNSVGTAGDVNGDGYDDVIVGAYFYDNGQASEGRAYIYHGSGTGLSLTPDWTAEGNQADAWFGDSVGTAGDVNGDGYDDVIVGASCFDNEGAAFVYHGSTLGSSATADWTAEGGQVAAHFGSSVGTAGDVNGDSYDDAMIGALLYDNGQTSEGRAVVYHGSASGLNTVPDWTFESNVTSAYLGQSGGTAGDVNSDGFDDVIIGATYYTDGQESEGRAYVFQGSDEGLNTTEDWTTEGGQEYAHLGFSVGTAGDVNGDGYDDVIIGAPDYDNGQEDEGRVFVFHGSATSEIPADIDGDGNVDVDDIMEVASRWRTTDGDPDWDPRCDLDGDGVITVIDIMLVAARWGDTWPPESGIYGVVTHNGTAAAGIDLRLRFDDGSEWSTQATTTTGADGSYTFTGVPSLAAGQRYYVLYGTQTANPDHLYYWHAPFITSYTSGESVAGGDFDVANVDLVSPAHQSTLPLPVEFNWQGRPVATDDYRLGLREPNADSLWASGFLGDAESYTLTSLPTGVNYDEAYWWEVWVYKGSDSYGLSQYYRTITFTESADMVTVPAGEFQMGCDESNPKEDCETWEVPSHTVYLDAYAIDTYEVTNAQYAQFLNAEGNQEEGGATWLDADGWNVRIHESGGGVWQADGGYGNHPVGVVTWYGARAYCEWLGKRLPTEAEWEKAARGSTDTRVYPWGDEDADCTRLNYCFDWPDDCCVDDTTPVGSYASGASPYGALDMAGNAYEWVNDWLDWDYYETGPYANPPGPASGDRKVLRGGSYGAGSTYAHVSNRISDPPDYSFHGGGFRCASDAP